MRGKIVNLCIALMNILFGILIAIYTIKVPQDETLLTVQEDYVVSRIVLAIYAILIVVVIINIVQSYNLKSDTTFNVAYVIGIFSISFFFIKQPIIATFAILCGVIIFFKSLKENLVELNSITGISVSIIVISATLITALLTLRYDAIGENIKNKENENELGYASDYFKYVTELDISEPYINVKKDGKFGYITSDGQTVIEFKYDYASPFVKITAYDKTFYVALVCENGSSYLILKNERVVLSYRTESADDNYGAKIEELESIYKNTLEQKDDMEYEIEEITDHINKAPVYQETSGDYDFRYDYNDEYDLLVTQSNMGLGDKYELAKKDDLNIRIKLDTTDLDYDTSYVYLFSNGTIPFYEITKDAQGWYTSYGKKNYMNGKAQILDFFEDRILLRDYNTDTVYFIDSNIDKVSDDNKLSDSYKDIYVCGDGRYIVRDSEDFFDIIDDSYNTVLQKKYAIINPRLISKNLYLVLDSIDNIKFNDYNYAKFSWSILNYDGEIILDGIEQIYDQFYDLEDTEKKDSDNYELFKEKIRELNYKFVGDKFYLDY